MPCNFQKLLFVLLFVLTSFFVSSIVGTSYSFLRRILGTLHSTKTSGLNFWQLPVASGTAFSGISKKGGNLTRYTQIFEKYFSPKFSFHSTLFPEFLELSVEWFAFSRYSQGGTLWTVCFQSILKKKILYIFSAFPCGPLNFSLHDLNTGL